MPTEPVVNGSQEWVMQADLPLTAAIRQSQQTLYHGHTTDRQGRSSSPLGLSGSKLLRCCTYRADTLTEGSLEVSHTNCRTLSICVCVCVGGGGGVAAVLRISPCHSRQPSVISDASAADGDRSSTPSDINSPRHRTHSLCNVRAAWPPWASNHTFFSCLCPSLCPVLLLGVRLPAWWWWCCCLFAFKVTLKQQFEVAFLISCQELDVSLMSVMYEAAASSC